MPNPQNIVNSTWKKGQSGNPKGKPKGALNRATIARKWLEMGQTYINPITKKKETLTQEDIITLSQVRAARNGSTNAYKALMDSAHGMPKQEVEQSIKVTETQTFKIGDQVISFD